jgi:hypothetical protein
MFLRNAESLAGRRLGADAIVDSRNGFARAMQLPSARGTVAAARAPPLRTHLPQEVRFMPDVQYDNWFSRLGKSLIGVLVGLILFVVAFPVLILNEGRAVRRARGLDEGKAACVSVDPAKVDETQEGKLVHVTGDATSQETLADPVFLVASKGLKLVRSVEIYQWVERSEEKRKKDIVGGGQTKVTSYFHKPDWVKNPVDSSKFHRSDSEQYKGQLLQNRGSLPYPDATQQAKEVQLGAYKLSTAQVNRLGSGEKLPVTNEMLAALPAELKAKWKVYAETFYLPFDAGSNLAQPQIGDVRVSFLELKPQKVSILAKQVKGSFEPWPSPSGSTEVDELRPGSHTKEAMFTAAQSENTTITWLLRGGGFLLMVIGIAMVFWPLVVFAEVLPLIGQVLGLGVILFAVLIALPLSLITIAIAWLAYRPIIGGSLLGGALIILLLTYIMGARRRAAKRRQQQAEQGERPPPRRAPAAQPVPNHQPSAPAAPARQAQASLPDQQFSCPSCAKVLKMKTAPEPGKKVRCPGCQTVFAVPGNMGAPR